MSENDDELQRIFEQQLLVERRRLGPAIDRDAWIMASRRIFAPGARQPCWVCGKFKSIAHAHHVVPLTAQYDRGFVYPDQELVLYIPTDDRSIAPAAMRARGRTTGALNGDLTEEEFNRLMELTRRSGRSLE